MRRGSTFPVCGAGLAAALFLAGPGESLAQPPQSPIDAHPARDPGAADLRPHATSTLDAAKAPPADQHQTRALAAAVFSRPSAALRAADKATAANGPSIPAADPKPEWLNDKGRDAHAGGTGVEVNRPF